MEFTCRHFGLVSSTMDVIRELLPGITAGGLIVTADSQSAGRGRIDGRAWRGAPGTSMLATIAIPAREADNLPCGRQTFPLKVGLAARAVLAEAYEPYPARCPAPHAPSVHAPSGTRLETATRQGLQTEHSAPTPETSPDCSGIMPQRHFLIKWPNDILGLAPQEDGKPDYRKLCGILCESFSGWLLAGIGINISPGSYPQEMAETATCLEEVVSSPRLSLPAEALARRIADKIVAELRNTAWKSEYEQYLWAKGMRVSFVAGHPERGTTLGGIIEGIDDSGGLVLKRGDGEAISYLAGEIASLRLDGVSRGGAHEARTTSVVDR